MAGPYFGKEEWEDRIKYIPVGKPVVMNKRAANSSFALDTLRDFVLLYRKTYMETQTHPTPFQESMVAESARSICLDFNIKGDF